MNDLDKVKTFCKKQIRREQKHNIGFVVDDEAGASITAFELVVDFIKLLNE